MTNNPKPIVAPAIKPQPAKAKRKHPRTNKDSWQNQPGRPQKRRLPSQYMNPDSPDYRPDLVTEVYSNHPKNASGRWICGAKTSTGKRCQRGAGKGTGHDGYGICSMHGGSTPVLSKAAAKYMGVDVVNKMTTEYGYGAPLILGPHEALLQEVSRTGGHVAWLAEQIGAWSMDTSEQISAVRAQWIELYHTERQMLVKAARAAIDAGVEERKVRLAEQQGALLLRAFNAVFDGLNLTVAQRRLLPKIVPPALRGITERASEDDYVLTPAQKTRIKSETAKAKKLRPPVLDAEIVED